LREKHRWLVVGGWVVPRKKYCWLVADKPSEQGEVEVNGQFNSFSIIFYFNNTKN
jgi:hypothetical protein